MSPSSSYDDFPSPPSVPTVRAGDARDALGRIDHYDLLRKLGGGGFGVVYLARDTASGVEVAIKTLRPLLEANAEEMDALREKFRLVHALTHPNIAKALVLHPVRDINVWDEAARQELRLSPGDSVMVMDYAPGATLLKWRRQFPDGVVPLGPALEIGRQLASALDYAHGERIIHRDVKPSNVMVETLPVKEEVRSTKDEGKRWDGPQKSQLATGGGSESPGRRRRLSAGRGKRRSGRRARRRSARPAKRRSARHETNGNEKKGEKPAHGRSSMYAAWNWRFATVRRVPS